MANTVAPSSRARIAFQRIELIRMTMQRDQCIAESVGSRRLAMPLPPWSIS
jgi:hypothetical protein